MRAALVMLLVSYARLFGLMRRRLLRLTLRSDGDFSAKIGMVLMALLLTAKEKPYNRDAFRRFCRALFGPWGAFLCLCRPNPRVGVAISFSLAQVAVVISTLGLIFILKRKVNA